MTDLGLICAVAERLRRHNWEAFSYSASVNLDNSLNVRISKRRELGFVYMSFHIYCLRCERLFLLLFFSILWPVAHPFMYLSLSLFSSTNRQWSLFSEHNSRKNLIKWKKLVRFRAIFSPFSYLCLRLLKSWASFGSSDVFWNAKMSRQPTPSQRR